MFTFFIDINVLEHLPLVLSDISTVDHLQHLCHFGFLQYAQRQPVKLAMYSNVMPHKIGKKVLV